MTEKTKKIIMTCPWPQYAKSLQEEGFYLICLWDHGVGAFETFVEVVKHSDEVYSFSFKDEKKMEDLVNWLMARHQIDYIYHLGRDEQIAVAYRIAEKYNMALNPPDSVNAMSKKDLTRDLLYRQGLSHIRYRHVKEKTDVMANAGSFGFPCIIKPTNSSGSKGVYLCKSTDDVVAWDRLMGQYDYEEDYLIEEFLEGPEISVETLSKDGEHRVIGITNKLKTLPPMFVEVGHIFPAQMDVDLRQQVEALVVGFLDAAGYRFGPAHTELILTDAGPKIVESQPRLAGDKIPVLVKETTGISMEHSVIDMLKGAPLPQVSAVEGMAMIHYFTWPQGRLVSLQGVDEVEKLPFVTKLQLDVQEGEMVKEVKDSFTRHGFVILKGENHDDLKANLKIVQETLTVTID